MRRIGAVITAFRGGLLLKPLPGAFAKARSRDFTDSKYVLSTAIVCILAAAQLVREDLIVDDRAGNRSALIAMLVIRCCLNFVPLWKVALRLKQGTNGQP